MLVLHGAFLDDSVAVWAEPESSKETLVAAVAELGLTLKFGKRIARIATAWLPTSEGRAAPSTALLADAPLEDPKTVRYEIAPHKVTILPLSARHTIDFVAACIDKRIVTPGLLI